MPKIVLLADTHFDNRKQFNKQLTEPEFQGCGSRFHYIAEAFRLAVDGAVKEDAEAVFLLGDVFHTRGVIPVAVYNAVYQLFEEASKKVNLVVFFGNHDCLDAKAMYASTGAHSIYSLQKTARIIDKPFLYESDSFICSIVPFNPSPEFTVGAAETLYKDSRKIKKISVLMLHHSVAGAVTGPMEWQMPHKLKPEDLPRFDNVFSGHYHKHQTISTYTYVGSPLQHDLGERLYTPGYVVLKDDRTFKQVENTVSPRFVVLETGSNKEVSDLREKDYKVIKWLGSEKEGQVLRESNESCLVEITPRASKSVVRTTISIEDNSKEMLNKYIMAKLSHVDDALLDVGVALYEGEYKSENITA